MDRVRLRLDVRTLVIALASLVVLGAATAVAAQTTDRPSFCSSCHEMRPYHAAWARSPHRSVSCVDCHVDSGTANRIAHKAVALGEVWSHFFSDPRFPNGAEIPDSRCIRCHSPSNIDPEVPGFDHEKHRSGRSCATCHDDVGHSVSATALAAAGVLDRAAYAARTASATPSQPSSAAATHARVGCASCHDLARTACVQCHTPQHGSLAASTDSRPCTDCHPSAASWEAKHPDDHQCQSCHARPANHRSGACTSCHSTRSWRFTHPSSGSCASCHRAPANHFGTSCASCHAAAGSWAFRHPAGGECQSCHTRPAGHRSGACTSCHTARSWRFTHPSSGSCTSCHRAPANHYPGSCTACHRSPGSWAFRHPSGGECQSCHARPANHRSGTCTSCHSTRSWRFTHPSSGSCASCHRAPANHYGTGCASCHRPGTAWSSATFAHPRIPGGEHTYRSFACSKCHPSGYTSATCTACHRGNPEDD